MKDIICKLSISEPTPYLRKHLAAELEDGDLAAELLEKREATIDPDFFDGTDLSELYELSYLSEGCIGTLSENFPGVSFKVVCYYRDFSGVWRRTFRCDEEEHYEADTPEGAAETLRIIKEEFGIEPEPSASEEP